MNLSTFNTIIGLISTFDTEQKCIDFLVQRRWNGNVISPFDKTSKVYKCGNNWFKCSKTNRRFNVRTGTMFECSKLPLKKMVLGDLSGPYKQERHIVMPIGTAARRDSKNGMVHDSAHQAVHGI